MASNTRGQKGSGEATLLESDPFIVLPKPVFRLLGHIINLCYSFRLLLWSIHCGESSGLHVVSMKLSNLL